jgi:hypothetical protein
LRSIVSRNPVKATGPVLFSLLCLLPLTGCLSGGRDAARKSAGDGIDTRPEGPAVEAVKVSGDGATVGDTDPSGRVPVSFAAQDGKPAALFYFADTSLVVRLGMALDITNRGPRPVRVFADINQDMWLRGYVTVAPGRTGTLYVLARLRTSAKWPQVAASDAPGFPEMHGIPGGKMWQWTGLGASGMASCLKVFVVVPRQDESIEVGNIRPFGSSKAPDPAGFFPFIDRYGQYSHKDWPGKVHSDADLRRNLLREDGDLADHPVPAGLDQYGGWAAGPQLRPTGHFRVEKREGRWWIVDPEGRLFWSNGIDIVGFNLSSTKIDGRERFFADPAPNGAFLERNLQAKYGPDWGNAARERILERLRSWGMNTIGGGSDAGIIGRRRVPYTLLLWTGGRGGPPIDPDNAEWADRMRRVLTEAAATARDDPWCLGFFVDNEIHLSRDPAWFERYYRQVAAVAKEVMPDTLYLGSRLDYHDWPDVADYRREIVRIGARYCDIVSFNFYKFTVDDFAMPEGVDRPAIIGEFHMGALDRGLFHTGLRGVIGQDQRAEAYRYYVTSALRNPAIVGAHWFQLYDESTTGRRDGENYQIGFLDICDTPYPETVAAARGVGYEIYAVRNAAE